MDLQHDPMNQMVVEEVTLYLLIIVSKELSKGSSLLEACLRRGMS